MIVIAFVAAAATGTLIRWVAEDRWTSTATLVVNVLGSFALGLLAHATPAAVTVVGTGGLGAMTTFSGLARVVHQMGGRGRRAASVAYAVGTVVAGIAAAGLGLAVAPGR